MKVIIREILEREVKVGSLSQAKVLYRNADIVLDASDLVDYDILIAEEEEKGEGCGF